MQHTETNQVGLSALLQCFIWFYQKNVTKNRQTETQMRRISICCERSKSTADVCANVLFGRHSHSNRSRKQPCQATIATTTTASIHSPITPTTVSQRTVAPVMSSAMPIHHRASSGQTVPKLHSILYSIMKRVARIVYYMVMMRVRSF